MTHHGTIVKNIVLSRGVSITELSQRLGFDRRTIYNWFNSSRLSLDIITRLGKALAHDFSDDFPEYSSFFSPGASKTSPPLQSENERARINYWKNKCLNLSEKVSALLEESEKDIKNRELTSSLDWINRSN